MFRKIIQFKLRFLAKLYLKKFKPKVIAITGSVGKTSAKEAIYSVLKDKIHTRKNVKNFNNEIGIPLTILGIDSGENSFLKWVKVILKAEFGYFLIRKYPKVLVLELGIDRPGDMDYLMSFLKPNIGVITSIPKIPVHLEFFKNASELAKEKLKLIKAIPKDGYAIYNLDNKHSKKAENIGKCHKISFGIKDTSGILKADNIVLGNNIHSGLIKPSGISFKLHYKNTVLPVRLPHIIGKHLIYSALIAVGVGSTFDLNLVDMSAALQNFKPLKGRMNLVKGIKGSVIIDDTYNAAPESTMAALRTLRDLGHEGRKIALLGDMRELGDKTKSAHKEVGDLAARCADVLITVGPKAKFIAKEAIKKGMIKSLVYSFDKSKGAGNFIQNQLQEGDLILVKGSRGIHMENAVLEICDDPTKYQETTY